MATLEIKDIDDDFYEQIKALANTENRSIGQQVLYIMREYFAKEKFIKEIQTPAEILLDLAGSWDDDRDADKISLEIKTNRHNSGKP